MKLLEIFRFEFAYQIRRVWTWLFFAVLVVVAFLLTREGSLAEALREDFFVNSPFAVAKVTVVGGLIWLLIAAAVAGEAAARDVATGMHPLTYTVAVTKTQYLGGKFLAAWALNALILLAVQVGTVIAVYTPGVHAGVIGPFRPAAYLTSYAFIAFPNAFAATAVQFAFAVRSGRPMASYLGSLLLFFMSFIVGIFLLSQGRQDLARLLDPIGVDFILSDLSHLWTTTEKSWRLIELKGAVLTNRVIWVGVGIAALALTHLRFRFAHRTTSSWWSRVATRRRARSAEPAATIATAPISVPDVRRRFDFGVQVRQVLAATLDAFRTITRSWAGIGMLVGIPLLTVAVVDDQMVLNGVPLVPATTRVLAELTGPLTAELSRWVIVPLLIIFFAGELVWRERDEGVAEIADAAPVSDWVPLLGKLLGLALVLVAFVALQMAAGMLAQTILGHREYEVGLYLKVLFGLQLPEYLLFVPLALAIHVLVDQKYIGHLAATIAYVFIIVPQMFGIEHNLLVYGAGPRWSYSEMSGFGASLGPWFWFKAYWAGWAVLLAVAAKALWVRGRERSPRVRLQLARRRLTRSTASVAAAAIALVLSVGGFVFYNTNVLNEYRGSAGQARDAAEYEKRYGRYESAAQPVLTGTRLVVEIHPERRRVEVRGSYQLLNRSDAAIDSIHVAPVPGVVTRGVRFDRPATGALIDDELGHRIYVLREPLQPGDSLRLDFEVSVAPRGFGEDGADASVIANGTYFVNRNLLPAIGYQRLRELTSAADRRKHGLRRRPLIPSLYDAEARNQWGGGMAFEAVVGTSADQVAVAPGALRRTWMANGRRYFDYAIDGLIWNEFAFFSARYAVHEARWNDVAIRIHHHPRHTAHLERMVRSIRASLDYYTRHFGPYRYRHLTVVERPGNGTGMHADASMITHEEGFSLWNPESDSTALDLPFAVVAHETAHQWTVPYAFAEGAPVLSESIAWYYGMQVVDEALGRDHLHRLLRFMRQPHPHPPIRRGEPLLRGLDPYMSYRRGPFALYALSEYVGEARLNGALRRFVEHHGSGEPPRATTLDLYRELRAVTPDSLQYLLRDLFEVNTFWQLETKRATAARTPAGTWQVALHVHARKVVFDSAGVETEIPMDESIEIGVFGRVERGDELGNPIYARKHRVRSGDQTIVVTVAREPVLAGVDPYHLLDWEERDDDDNIEAVGREK